MHRRFMTWKQRRSISRDCARNSHPGATATNITSWHPFESETRYGVNYECKCGAKFWRQVSSVEAHDLIDAGVPFDVDHDRNYSARGIGL